MFELDVAYETENEHGAGEILEKQTKLERIIGLEKSGPSRGKLEVFMRLYGL